MANRSDTSDEYAPERKEALAFPEQSYTKASERPAHRRVRAAFFFAVVVTAGAAPNAAGAGADRTPACAAQDLSALAVIEERSEVIGMSTQQVVEASRRFLQARDLCLSGHQDDGIALYQNAINTALGFDTPSANAITRITAAGLGTPLHSR